MAGLTKEQRAQRDAETSADSGHAHSVLVAMHCEFPAFPGAPTEADVHPDEVENWKAAGWTVKE